MRKRLADRGMSGDWTDFESLLFNLVTQRGDQRDTPRLIFSKRLAVVQAMLDAYDAEVAVQAALAECDQPSNYNGEH